MSSAIPVADGIHWVGANDYETNLFEAIWPLPRGISYNAYLVADEKVALVDAVKEAFLGEMLQKVRDAVGPDRPMDYLVINHMEPDHSGAVRALRGLYPDMQIVGNRKTAEFLKKFFGVEKNVRTVEDGETLSLGSRDLAFHVTPMVHWPETMMTYDSGARVLFSGDAFGGFGALAAGIFDDEVDIPYYEDEILRYFSNIIGKYCRPVQKAIEKLGDLSVEIVASTHGPVWRNEPQRIIDTYARWSRQETQPGVVVAFASMYGSTQQMAEAVAHSLAEAGVEKVRVHDLSRTHVSYVIRDVWRFKGLVVGGPTYNTRLFPLVEDLVGHLENDRLRGRLLGIFGTYAWSGGAVDRLRSFAEDGGDFRLIEPVVEAECRATPGQLDQCAEMGRNMAAALKDRA
ncbi:MAG: FprA family A-type flavoprotein [Phycisphaerae bacterium]